MRVLLIRNGPHNCTHQGLEQSLVLIRSGQMTLPKDCITILTPPRRSSPWSPSATGVSPAVTHLVLHVITVVVLVTSSITAPAPTGSPETTKTKNSVRAGF